MAMRQVDIKMSSDDKSNLQGLQDALAGRVTTVAVDGNCDIVLVYEDGRIVRVEALGYEADAVGVTIVKDSDR